METQNEMSTRIHREKIEWANAHAARFVFQRLEAVRGILAGGKTGQKAYAVFLDLETEEEFATSFFISENGVIWQDGPVGWTLEKDPPALPLPKSRGVEEGKLLLGHESKENGRWRGGYYLSDGF